MAPSERHALRLTDSPQAPGLARKALVEWVAGRVDADTLQDAKLLVSELVTNGVRHAPAGGAIELQLQLTDGKLRVEVADTGGRFTAPKPVEPPLEQASGRGLMIVDRIATTWGTSHNGRNTVWFEL